MEKSGHTQEVSGVSGGPPAPKLLLGIPLAALAVLLVGLLALAVLLGVAGPSCGESRGDLNSKVPARLAPIYTELGSALKPS